MKDRLEPATLGAGNEKGLPSDDFRCYESGGRPMINFESRTYGINEFLEWSKNGQLELNPRFQRRSVWSPSAKSYLIDTILRGKPIPKIFIRQKLNMTTRQSVREVVDGQQRLRTILSFLGDGFAVMKTHNEQFGGMKFSQLPENAQADFLTFSLSVDLLINLPDYEVLDIFNRLNSYAVVLNEQEKINATHFGEFKTLADNIAYKYNSYWLSQEVWTPKNILRMQEINLVADLLIAMKEGIKSKKQVRRYYAIYEKDFDADTGELARRFDSVVSTIGALFPEGLSSTEFSRPFLFYSLFTAVAHCMFGLPEDAGTAVRLADRVRLDGGAPIERARHGLDRVSEIFETELAALNRNEQEFLEDSRRATTDEAVRKRRTNFLLRLMV